VSDARRAIPPAVSPVSPCVGERRTGRVLLGALAVGAITVVAPARPAFAACHAFTVEVAPSTVTEGAAVRVTVSRDAGVAPSQIDFATDDRTARDHNHEHALSRLHV
jgi:hypothetical protein